MVWIGSKVQYGMPAHSYMHAGSDLPQTHSRQHDVGLEKGFPRIEDTLSLMLRPDMT